MDHGTGRIDICKEFEPGKGTDVRGWQDRTAAEQGITAALERAMG